VIVDGSVAPIDLAYDSAHVRALVIDGNSIVLRLALEAALGASTACGLRGRRKDLRKAREATYQGRL
jgi:hypothetical protein